MTPVLPGATIGIFGGGQLGRMMTLAARVLGYHVIILDPDPKCAAGAVADRVIAAKLDDVAAATELARACDVITVEIEKIGAEAMAAASAIVPVRPGGGVLYIIQDRARQKRWLADHEFPLGPFRVADSAAELADAMKEAGAHAFVKSAFGGYDGRGQARTEPDDDPAAIWSALGSSTCVVEKALDLESEISVMVARRPDGSCATFPPALNHHVNGVLDWSVIPAPVPEWIALEGVRVARGIAEQMDVVGLLAVEMFVLRNGTLVVNELAPRPHNSFHHTELASLTSQFEQGIRAVCDLPLGNTGSMRPAAIANLFGDLWLHGAAPRWEEALAMPAVRLHLYGKSPRPGRKMGHVGAVAEIAEEAVALAIEARARLLPR
ncbi:MAG TPA: 5-(carboxyamino)imidazole ribonucleotide synthase [Gemmatimonadaceae bacterium]|nr:5-(carboxyamino)imidazole ribonucleotide synthase [Gemmatimonadaceae bacterium]